METLLELQAIDKRYPGSAGHAVKGVSFRVEKGDIVALVGESGSGKTTLLRIIAGLEHPERGVVLLSGRAMTEGSKTVPVHLRNIGMVFQDYALFPHMTIAQNIAFGIQQAGRNEKERIVKETLALVGLHENPAKYPHQLSGGQQQRVALARALAPRPDVLLLDEPFSNLDTVLRDQVRDDLHRIVKSTGITTILVTHDTRDALGMADKIAVLHHGRLLQYDRPGDIYESPESVYVAHLFGKFSCLAVEPVKGGYSTAFGWMEVAEDGAVPEDGVLFCRPEHVHIRPETEGGIALSGIVERRTYLGDCYRIHVVPEAAGKQGSIVLHSPCAGAPEKGDRIRFRVDRYKIVNFGADDVP